MSKRLNGKELEDWFKDFAKRTGILNETPFKMEKIIGLLDEKLNQRLNYARTSIHNYFIDGQEWIEKTLNRQSLPYISEKVKNDFANRLADLAIGTDLVLKLKDTSGRAIQIAVDVTSNDMEVDNKLRKVRGYALPNSSSKINKNIPIVRAELGIDKHLVILLERTPGRLPSDEKLLEEIYSFAESVSVTRSLDLTNLDPSERTNWRQLEAANPEQMWQKYSKGVQSKASNVIALEAAKRAFRDDHTSEAVFLMLTHDPQYRQFLRRDGGDSKFADLHVRAIRAGAEVEVAKEQQQRKPQQSREPERGVDGPEL